MFISGALATLTLDCLLTIWSERKAEMHGLFSSGHFVYLISQAAHIEQNKVSKPIRQCGNVFASSLKVFNIAQSIACSLNILHLFFWKLLLNSPLLQVIVLKRPVNSLFLSIF